MEPQCTAEYVDGMAMPLLRAPVLAFVLGGGLSVWTYHTITDDSVLQQRIQQLEIERDALQKRVYFLRERERVARVHVIDQQPDRESPGQKRTSFRFEELDGEGAILGEPREFTIDGDLLYVDAQVIKFDEEFLGEHELERGTTLLLFRRLFGEFQAPADGFMLDSLPRAPHLYSAEEAPDTFTTELWSNFWDYANRPEILEKTGVRAMHGEAPYIRLEAGRSYQIELRSSDGLTIRAFRE